MQRLLIASLVVVLALPAAAQIMSAEITPPSAQPGQTITLTIRPNQAVVLPSGCAAGSIRDGINGNPVALYACPAIIVMLSPCASYSMTWNQIDATGNQAPPGTYWFEVAYFSPAGNLVSEWFCFRLEAAGGTPPTLKPFGPLVQGQSTVFEIDSPGTPGGFYIMLASLTSNTGIALGNDVLCLDDDFVLSQSFPTPNPAVFTGFQGFLDGNGYATGFGITMPNFPPGVSCIPFHTQALIFDFLSNSLVATNGVTHTIL